MREITNKHIAIILDEIANLLEIQEANPHRVRAYRSAAQYVERLDFPIRDIIRSGDGLTLQSLPYIGERLARLIEEVVRTGKSVVLERLKGSVTAEEQFAHLPGIGPQLAERIVHHLDIHTLEDLETAAHDGRLSTVPGFGKRRIDALKWSLEGFLARRVTRLKPENRVIKSEPSVATILKVDDVYRHKAAAGKLRLIAPKRFNPEGKAWLPVMHLEEDDWSFTALYSNTSRAHNLGKTSDWVVIFYEKEGREGQVTVVTETHGSLKGNRVVRGREKECGAYYLVAQEM